MRIGRSLEEDREARGWLWLQVFFSHGMEYIECLQTFVFRHDAMRDAAGNEVHVAWNEHFLDITDLKQGATVDHHANLLVRMGMAFDDRMRLEHGERQAHLVAGGSMNLHAGKNVVRGTLGR